MEAGMTKTGMRRTDGDDPPMMTLMGKVPPRRATTPMSGTTSVITVRRRAGTR